MTIQNIFSKKNIASFSLILMSIQIVGIEGWAISIPKVVYMCMCPLLLLGLSPKISKAVILSVIFWGTTFLLNIIQFENQRLSTFYYTLMFLSIFCLFYNLVWEEHCYELDDFLRLIKGVVYAYIICLFAQQFFLLLGIRYLPIANLTGAPWHALFRTNSLAIEPSHAARVLTVYFYAFLKLVEIKNGGPASIKQLLGEYRWFVLGFLYTMFAIGSGTAMVGLAVLSLYFLKRQYVMIVVLAAFLLYFFAPYIDYDPLNRAMATFDAALTMDEEQIREADRSASDRVNMLVSLFKYTDLTDPQTWLGHGTDAVFSASGGATHGAIYNYGFISYLLKLLLYFSCAIPGLFSLGTLMFVLLFTMNIGNIAYGFACLMVFSGLKYFVTLYGRD